MALGMTRAVFSLVMASTLWNGIVSCVVCWCVGINREKTLINITVECLSFQVIILYILMHVNGFEKRGNLEHKIIFDSVNTLK